MAGWGPLRPAQIDFSDPATPSAPAYGDVYHARAGAVAQARAVFLAGNGLPARWRGRRRCTVLETGFGLGHTFLATWQAWRDDPQRSAELVFVSVEKHPPTREDLRRAHALAHGQAAGGGGATPDATGAATREATPVATPVATGDAPSGPAAGTHPGDTLGSTPLADLAAALQAAWPPATPDLHLLSFDGGAVRLLLAFGDARTVLPELQLQADAVFLDGFAPRVNAELWSPEVLRQLPRLCAPDATLATWCVTGALRQSLAGLGFEVRKQPGFGGKREMTVARHAPRHVPPAPPGRPSQPAARQVAVVGAGLAGAAVARALARQGLQVTVLERLDIPAGATSGNAGGLFHSVLHPDDGPHARWLRASALHTARELRPLVAEGRVPGAVDGLLRGERQQDATAMQARLDAQGQPADHVQALAGGMPDGAPAWFYPDGGWVSPSDLVRHWLAAPGITLHTGVTVDRLEAVDLPVKAGTHPGAATGSSAQTAAPDAQEAAPGTPTTMSASRADIPAPSEQTAAPSRPDMHAKAHTASRRWRLWAADGRCLAEVDAVVLCNADDAARLCEDAAAHWPLTRVRGQTTVLPADAPGLSDLPLQRPLADGGYALRLADGRVLCGAVAQPGDEETALRAADHASHLRTLQRLTGWCGRDDSTGETRPDGAAGTPGIKDITDVSRITGLTGRVGWRLVAEDRLPLLGPVPRLRTAVAAAAGAAAAAAAAAAETAEAAATSATSAAASPAPADRPARALTQVRQVEREPGLWLFIALGSRGLTQAALAGELLAAQLTGAPWPVPLSLAEALDPARFRVRAERRAGRPAQPVNPVNPVNPAKPTGPTAPTTPAEPNGPISPTRP